MSVSSPVDAPPRVPDAVPAFRVSVRGFDGPFDLLLQLITKHELDVTEIALSRITDDFIAHIRGIDDVAGLDEVSEFLVVGATLLDLKIAGLLPRGEVVDQEEVALLEARDLLFARLLQYRAFKRAAGWFAEVLETERTRHARVVPPEERHREAAPELVWTLSPDDFAALATLALAPRREARVTTEHLHAPVVSIREEAAVVVALLRGARTLGFRDLVEGADRRGVVVARFLAVLELYRGGALAFEQVEPLGELTLRWTAAEWDDARLATLGSDPDD